MMHRLATSTNAAAIALQNAAELRRSQSTGSSTATTTTTASAQAAGEAEFAAFFDQLTYAGGSTPIAATTGKASTFSDAIASATANVAEEKPDVTVSVGTAPIHSPFVDTETTTKTTTDAAATPTTTAATTTAASTSAGTTSATTAATTETATTQTTATSSTSSATSSTSTTPATGMAALVGAIMDGSLHATYVTNQSQLAESTPYGTTDYMPNFYYASDQTAQQIASLLGGTVVQMAPFSTNNGFDEPPANFIQLPNGQTFNAADIAYYANAPNSGETQLTADLTQTINEGSAWTEYYKNGGTMPTFPENYVGPPISGLTYPPGTIDAYGNVINPAVPSTSNTQTSTTQGT